MSPSSSCFNFETSVTTSPFRTVELFQSGSTRVEDTMYLGRLFNLSASSPLRDCHRAAKNSYLRRPNRKASARSASSSATFADPSRSLLPTWANQPPCLKPSSPVGSWTTPSSVTFSLMTIFPISLLLSMVVSATTDADAASSGIGRPPTAQFGPRPASIECGKGASKKGGVRVERADLMSRARAGDGDAFRELTEPYRRELQVHCYRMLGSFSDAEDALQDTLLAAWQSLGGFEERASLRTWLYRIATNKSLDARRSASRRPAKEWDVPNVEPPEPTRAGEVVWLEPYPDALLEGATGVPLGPEARYEQTEAISLAFVTALQVLPPRQLAALILRDVLGFHASEVAGMLDSTVESVNSAFKRARASLQRQRAPAPGREPPPAAGSPAEDALVARFVSAYEAADLDALVALLTDDVFISMPPMPFEYEGRDVAARFCASLFGAGRRYDLVPTRANGQPAFGTYLRSPAGVSHGTGMYVLTCTGDRICAMTRFENSVLPWFGLPRSLPSR